MRIKLAILVALIPTMTWAKVGIDWFVIEGDQSVLEFLILEKEKNKRDFKKAQRKGEEFEYLIDLSKRFENAVKSQGFLDAKVGLIQHKPPSFLIKTKKRYRIQEIIWKDKNGLVEPIIRFEPGAFATSDRIFGERMRLADWISDRFCFYEVLVSYRAQPIKNEELKLSYLLEQSGHYFIGKVRFSGTKVDSKLLSKIVDLNTGDCLRKRELDRAVLELISTDLFSIVKYQLSANSNGTQDIDFLVTEKEHRTLGVGLGYNSDIGPGVSFDWIHRNLRERGENVELKSQISNDHRRASVSYGVPSLLNQERSLSLLSEFEQTQLLDTILTVKDVRFLMLEPSGTHSELHYGIKFSESYTFDEQYNLLISTPVGWQTHAVIDASSHLRWKVLMEPYFIPSSDARFYKAEGSIQLGLPFSGINLSARSALGKLLGVEDEVPLSERYFLGGATTVRGFHYNSLGEDIGGGLSFVTASIESHLLLGGPWTGLSFVDAGNVFADTLSLSQLELGLGFGIQYETGWVPIRLDLAWPAKGLNSIESMKIYLSIGQP